MGSAPLSVLSHAAAHELGIDQLVVRRRGQRLDGELQFDPQSTRPDGTTVDAGAREKVLALVRGRIHLRVGGSELPFDAEVRELWSPGGPVAGDLVTLTATLPSEAALSLEISSRPPLLPLVVSVQAKSADSRMAAHSWLLTDTQWSPPFPLAERLPEQAPEGWTPGGPEAVPLPRSAPAAPSPVSPAAAPPPPGDAALLFRFARLGFVHVLPLGLDHLAFVAVLVTASLPRWSEALWALTAFTLAHSITLALAGLQLVSVPSGLVEPLIAASVAVMGLRSAALAVRVQRAPTSAPPPRLKAAVALAFAFGLLHGLGFAGALLQLDLPGVSFWVALVGFNLGVEGAQLASAVALAGALKAASRIVSNRFHTWLIFLVSLLVAGFGTIILIDRTASGLVP